MDVVIDTDAYNEIDDDFAIAYAFCSQDKMRVKAIYAAPFKNERADTAKEGMEKSYAEILKLLSIMGNSESFRETYEGSRRFLSDEKTPVDSAAARDLAARAMEYTTEKPLYVIAIAALTNVASALLINPDIADRIVLVWLGGNAVHCARQFEFNLRMDIDAANVCLKSVRRIVQLPCSGVVSDLITTEPELRYWLGGKNALCDYLINNVTEFHRHLKNFPWSKQIWDVAPIAYILNTDNQFALTKTERVPTYTKDFRANYEEDRGSLIYVNKLYRDKIFADLFKKLSNEKLFAYPEQRK